MVDKHAQYADIDNLNLGEFLLPVMDGDFPVLEIGDNIEVSEDEPEEVVFSFDYIPGAPDAKEIIVVDDEDQPVEIEADEPDMWKWEVETFIPWIYKMFKNVPSHSGYGTAGLERAISYLEFLDKEITKGMRNDFKGLIDSEQVEQARDEIEKGLEHLVERLEKVKGEKRGKKARGWVEETGILKNAQKSTRINGITITVPLLISRIARVCINGMVSAGHDIEDMYQRQVEEYNLDKREQAELSQLLADMGYAMIQDRGYAPGTPVETWRNDNFDWSSSYKG